jgi:hypothetical protein
MTFVNERYLDILLHDAALAAARVLHHNEGIDTSLLRQRLQAAREGLICEVIYELSFQFLTVANNNNFDNLKKVANNSYIERKCAMLFS